MTLGELEWDVEEVETPPDEDWNYPIWDSSNSRVVSGPIGQAKFPGRMFPSAREAMKYWRQKARIVACYPTKGRWIFRIATGGKK